MPGTDTPKLFLGALRTIKYLLVVIFKVTLDKSHYISVTEFCEFCASGKRPAFIGVGNEYYQVEQK